MPWSKFIKAHLGVLVGMDLFTVEVVTWLGLFRYHVLLAIEISEYVKHYHRERFHRALGGQLLQKAADEDRRSGKVVCRSRLGGMLNFYHREAA